MEQIKFEKLDFYKNQINQYIVDFIDSLEKSEDFIGIYNMFKYVLINNSKKLRSIFILLFGEILGVSNDSLKNYCIAVEMIHSYTLIHDDLPALDNDVMRRGKPTAHLAFGESSAILLGDGLHSLGFELFSRQNSYFDSKNILKATNYFLNTMGIINGVLFGQFLDIKNNNKEINESEIYKIHHHKTAIFFAFCTSLPAILSGKNDKEIKESYDFGLQFGKLFQFLDDIDDFHDKDNEVNICNILGYDIAVEKYQNDFEKFLTINKFQQLNDIITKLLILKNK